MTPLILTIFTFGGICIGFLLGFLLRGILDVTAPAPPREATKKELVSMILQFETPFTNQAFVQSLVDRELQYDAHMVIGGIRITNWNKFKLEEQSIFDLQQLLRDLHKMEDDCDL
jgi:hypothetical protein